VTSRRGGAPPEEPPPLRLPEAGLVFEGRAARLRALAQGHAAPEWLLLLSRIAAGQAAAVRDVRVAPARAGWDGPPLALERLPRDAAWRRMLAVVLSAASSPALPVETRDAIDRLSGAGPSALDEIADAIVAGAVPRSQRACTPFVAAALQAWLAALAGGVEPTAIVAGVGGCPVCGGSPVAGLVQGDDRLRYVSCALCCSEWHVPRIRCTSCGREDGLSYFHVEGDRGAQAEACRACHEYLKLFDEEARPGAEPAADDAATIALDLLMVEQGYRRAGVNLYVATGGEDP
jgi:FdhE protein